MNITNEQIVERVARMGVEHRAGRTIEQLWDLARQELRRVSPPPVRPARSFEAWAAADERTDGLRYAFTQLNGRLTIVRVVDPSSARLVGWRTPHLPEVTLGAA